MRALISQCPQRYFLLSFPPLSETNRKFIFSACRKCFFKPLSTISSSLPASCSTNSAASYNGWDDLRIRVDSDELGESGHFKKTLILLGIDDKKYVFTCILGFVCALALSRVRFSSLVVFPAAAIIFSIGFSFGFVKGRPNKGLGLNGSKRRAKDESLTVYVKKLRNLTDLFDGFEVKVIDLNNDIKKAIDYEAIEVDDLERYMDTVESIGALVLNARNVVEECIDSVSAEGQVVQKNLIQKHGRKKREVENNGFDLFEFMGRILRGNTGASKPKLSKTNFVRRDNMTKDVSNQDREDLRGSAVERLLNAESSKDTGNLNGRSWRNANGKFELDDIDVKAARSMPSGRRDTMETFMRAKSFPQGGGLNYKNVKFMNNRRLSLNLSAYGEIRASGDSTSGDTEFDLSKRHMKIDGSLKHQQILQKSYGTYEYSKDWRNTNYELYRENLRKERMIARDELHSMKYQSQHENALDSFPSSAVSDDVLFDKCLTSANDLLKQAKECLKIRNDEMLTQGMLDESAKLLSEAIAMKPMSLLAIGQLGNTYLLHGELKLRTSRELRKLLSGSDEFGVKRQSNLQNRQDESLPSKDEVANLLVDVCEECEALLVEAGRKYKTALAIDGNDLRALYNWGLALSFRAQLIADIGPDAALDADKLFLAAIDKFDAMMSRSNSYAPEALFRWGVALQQRSRLRPSNSREKVKLLQQAKRLYEDALDMGSNNLQVTEALSTCISELNFSDI